MSDQTKPILYFTCASAIDFTISVKPGNKDEFDILREMWQCNESSATIRDGYRLCYYYNKHRDRICFTVQAIS